MKNALTKRMKYCLGSGLELFSASLVLAVCQDSNVLRMQKKDKEQRQKIGNADVVPVFTSAKIEKYLRHSELKPAVVRNQCVAYQFKCDLCDTGYNPRHPRLIDTWFILIITEKLN